MGNRKLDEKEQEFLRAPAGAAPTIDQPPITEAPGHQIGHYTLLQQIGEGGFGVVFMAEQTHPVRRKVAIKIIKPGMDTKAVVARFEAIAGLWSAPAGPFAVPAR